MTGNNEAVNNLEGAWHRTLIELLETVRPKSLSLENYRGLPSMPLFTNRREGVFSEIWRYKRGSGIKLGPADHLLTALAKGIILSSRRIVAPSGVGAIPLRGVEAVGGKSSLGHGRGCRAYEHHRHNRRCRQQHDRASHYPSPFRPASAAATPKKRIASSTGATMEHEREEVMDRGDGSTINRWGDSEVAKRRKPKSLRLAFLKRLRCLYSPSFRE